MASTSTPVEAAGVGWRQRKQVRTVALRIRAPAHAHANLHERPDLRAAISAR